MKVLKFGADWCAACKSLSRTLEGATIPIQELDLDTDSETAITMRIRSVPTLVLVDDSGAEIRRITGAITRAQFEKFIIV